MNNETKDISTDANEITTIQIEELSPIKTQKFNWVFPFMSCLNGVLQGATCDCSLKAPAFLGENCCYVQDENDPKAQPKLCPEFIQK